MRTVYIADDGKQFENEYECERYEFEIIHPNLKIIEFYDKDGLTLSNAMDEDTYNICTKVIVHSNEEITDLHAVANYFGYYAYFDIDDVGEWVYCDDEEKFKKYEDIAFVQELSDKYVEILKECRSIKEQEYADNTLLKLLSDLGYIDVVEAYRKVPKWYS